ncbi:hypothetical protein [Aeromonas veronii]|uniref:hypothetical protein n=1 Tax=Aeromonas veronii TaxID=654 RepID=UPI0010124045|nr:hypothetical protein [Aeromonas veronii]
MTSEVIVDGDMIVFEPQFGNRLVTLLMPAMIRGSGHAIINKKKVCIKGDEGKLKFDAMYTTSSHTIPGKGIVSIQQLDPSNVSSVCHSDEVVITLGNNKFTACFTPSTPAMTPPPTSSPDPAMPSYGKGEFMASQQLVCA